MKVSTILLVLLAAIPGCSKNNTVNDSTAPVISLNTPSNAQVFTAGQTISIKGTINDDQYIAEVHIHVSNLNSGALLMDVHLYPGAANTSFDQSITAVSGVNYRIQVLAKDKAVNEGRASVDVSAL